MPNPKMGAHPGTPAPDFALAATNGQTIRLSDLHGQWVVLYFFRGTW